MPEATTSIKRVKLGKEPRRDHRALGPDSKRYIDRRQLLQKLGLSYPSVWKKMRAGTFPAPFICGGKNLWLEDEIDAYVASLERRSYPSTAQGGRHG